MVTTMSLFHPNECQIWRTIPLKFLPNTRTDVQKIVTPDKSTRKQPRVNVMPRQLRQDTDSTGKL